MLQKLLSCAAWIIKLVCSLRVLGLFLVNGWPRSNYCKYSILMSTSITRTFLTTPHSGPHLQPLCKAAEISSLPTTLVSDDVGHSMQYVAYQHPVISL